MTDLVPIDDCEHPILNTISSPPQDDLVFECETCGKQAAIAKLAVMQCQGNLNTAISGIIALVFGEPWREEAMKKRMR